MNTFRLCCLLGLLLTLNLQSAVSYFDFDDVVFQTSSSPIHFDLDATSTSQVVSSTQQSGTDFTLYSVGNPWFFTFNSATWKAIVTDNAGLNEGDGMKYHYAKLSEGTVLANESSVVTTLINIKRDGFDSPWDGEDGTTKRYLGFRNTTLEETVWLGVYYDSAGSKLTFTDMARGNNDGDFDDFSIFATGDTLSAVPEPGETALMTAILMAGAGFLNRRRQRTSSIHHGMSHAIR